MATYRNVQMSFWTDSKVSDDFTPEDKYFYLYLFTNPHTNLCGCYEISIKTISYETGYSKETIERLIERFEKFHKVICHSKKSKEILILNWHKYNWTNSEKFLSGLDRSISDVKDEKFREYLFGVRQKKDRVSIPYTEGSDTTLPVTDTFTVTDTAEDTVTDTAEDTVKDSEQADLQLICPQCRPEKERTFTVDEILEMASQEIGRAKDSSIFNNFAASCGESQKAVADCGLNPIQSESNRIQSNPNPNPNPNPTEDARACACETMRHFNEFWSAYPSKKRMLKARGEYAYVLKTTEDLTEDMLISAAKNYAEECRIKRGDGMYIMHPDNWLRDSVWIDYLPGKYQKPEKKRIGNVRDNNNFQRRQYDFDNLEGQLLGANGDGGA